MIGTDQFNLSHTIGMALRNAAKNKKMDYSKRGEIDLFQTIWLLQTLAEDDVKDAETKFQLCNNLACVLNSETEEEIEYKESLFDLVKDDAAVLSYAIHYLDDWLPDSAE